MPITRNILINCCEIQTFTSNKIIIVLKHWFAMKTIYIVTPEYNDINYFDIKLVNQVHSKNVILYSIYNMLTPWRVSNTDQVLTACLLINKKYNNECTLLP